MRSSVRTTSVALWRVESKCWAGLIPGLICRIELRLAIREEQLQRVNQVVDDLSFRLEDSNNT
jgi:hypothetical protein